MITSYILLGSNLEEPLKQVETALEEIQKIPNSQMIATSRFYRSKALGPSEQPDYINVVTALNTELSAHQLLEHLQSIENKHGRVRTTRRWGPRTLDLDLLLYGNRVIHTPKLIVPHPELKNRNFVLFPLADIAKDLTFPDGEALTSALQRHTMDGLEAI